MKGEPGLFDVVLMFKILIIQAQNSLSDERAEYLISDRLSFMGFLGLMLSDPVPDAKTIWLPRERLLKASCGSASNSGSPNFSRNRLIYSKPSAWTALPILPERSSLRSYEYS